jgi:hypothetical protein
MGNGESEIDIKTKKRSSDLLIKHAGFACFLKLTATNLKQSRIGSRFASYQFYLDNFATHFHNPLLFPKPTVIRN